LYVIGRDADALMVNRSYLIPDMARVNETLDEQAQSSVAKLSEHDDDSDAS
jgi:hypothetical protein